MKILDFARKEAEQAKTPPVEPTGLFFGAYALWREDAVLLSRPLFDLILIRLDEGTPDAKALAAGLRTSVGQK